MTRGESLQIEDMPLELLSAPLDWFFFEHLRHRQLCRLIDAIAEAESFDARSATRVIRFLRFERPLHILDEEEDFFPLLRRRSLPEDELDAVMELLSADHGADADHAGPVRAILELALVEGSLPAPPDGGAREALKRFANRERQHLALENAVVLPIGRLRLSDEDLADLGSRLAARRGLTLEAPPPSLGGRPHGGARRRPPARRRRRAGPCLVKP